MTVKGISVTGPDAAMFAQTSTCASVLMAGQSCTVSVTFTPTTAGAKAGTLGVSTDAATNPAVALSGTGTIVVQPTGFTDVTTTSGVAHTSESYGASWGDVNGDGYLDLWVSNHRTAKNIYVNQGNGTFVDIAPTINNLKNRPSADTHGASWADAFHTGDQDLLVSIGRGNPSEWYVNNNGALSYQSVGSGFDLGTNTIGGRTPTWLDYDGDHRLDVIVANYDGPGELFHQNANGTFTESHAAAKMLCLRFYYVQLIDVTGDGRLDVLCSDETKFPQKIYDTSAFPWKKLYDNAAPASFFPIVTGAVDSAVADFNNDGHMDMFILGGAQTHPSSVVQEGNKIEASLVGGSKGMQFVTSGIVTFTVSWNKASEGVGTDIKRIQIGASGRHPAAATFTLNPADPTVAGMPPVPTDTSLLPLMQMGYNPATQRWIVNIVTKLTMSDPSIFSQGYIQVSSTASITGSVGTGLWAGDVPSRPTLLINRNGTFVDETLAWGLGTKVQCGSVTAGDFDNDMYVDLYLACRTGASNIANILYHNNGDGTFTALPNAGGAAGPVGLGIADGVGWAESVVSGDYDVDGFLDLFVTNGLNLQPPYIGGPHKLYHNNGNANHWIELDLVGVNSDRDATGARVYADALGVTQFRVQDGRIHRWSQDAKRIHFGLAGATAVTLTVKWPSGTVQTFTNVPANVLYKITENTAYPVPVTLH